MSGTTRRLLAARTLRATSQGILIVAYTLYLKELGWSGAGIGAVLGGYGVWTAFWTLVIGPLTDRYGSRPFLLTFEVLVVLCGIACTFSDHPWVLGAATIIAGFGRGQTGAAGPFSASESVWLAEALPASERGPVYSLNAGLGFFGMALGSLLAGWIPNLHRWLPGTLAYRPMFSFTAVLAVIGFCILATTPGGVGAAPRGETGPLPSPSSWKPRLAFLALTNAFNGIAIGLTNPLIAYWFAVRFGVGPAALGPVFFLAFLLTGCASLITGRLSRSMGIVPAVVASRTIGVGMFVALPLVPTLRWAEWIYIGRSAVNRGTAGARQAAVLSLVPKERRGLAIAVNNVSMQLPGAAGPAIGGWLMGHGELSLPFFLAAGLQAGYLFLYTRVFRGLPRNMDPDA
ncbi:MAG: MFS transporter [Candidatus Xenobia bacterium]